MSAVAEGVPAPRARTRAGIGNLAVALVIFAGLAIAPFGADALGGSYVLSLLMKAMLLAIAAISLDLLLGHGGLVSFGHAAFIGIGAYATGIGLEEGVYNGLALLAFAVLASAAFALITGAISLRTSGVYFIMITLAFGQMAFFAFSSLSAYGGDDGLTLWSTAELYGTGWLQNGGGLYFVILGTLVFTWWLVNRIAGSRFGRVLRAAKENPVRVETMGYSVFRYRLVAYVIAGALAGASGFLLANQAEFVSPAAATWQRSGELIFVVIIGGMGARNGALLGALFFVLMEEVLSSIIHDWRLIFGPILVLIALYAHGGLVSLLPGGGKEGPASDRPTDAMPSQPASVRHSQPAGARQEEPAGARQNTAVRQQ
ncbi:MAG: branched-chain amino acid ABC transporter permease [Pseudomonadota bacterium]